MSQLADQGEQKGQGQGEVEDQVGHHPQEDGSPLEDLGEDARGPPEILINQTFLCIYDSLFLDEPISVVGEGDLLGGKQGVVS